MGHRAVWLGLGMLSVLCTLEAYAQSPAGGELLVNRFETKGPQGSAKIACERSGACVLVWGSLVPSEDEPGTYETTHLVATALAPSGGVFKERIFADELSAGSASIVRVGQLFAVFWIEDVVTPSTLDKTPFYQWLDRDLVPQSGVISLPTLPEPRNVLYDVEPIPGGFVQLGPGSDVPLPDYSDGAFLYFVDYAGHELRPPVRVSADALGEQRVGPGGLTVDPAGGILTVVYSQHIQGAEDAQSDIFYRRFSMAGEPLTPDVQVNSYLPLWQTSPEVATAPNGDFIVTWTSDEQDGSYDGIFGQRFSRDGLPSGPEFQVNQETRSDQRFAQISTDTEGNFVVVWQTYELSSWDIKARLYRADGTPVGPEVFVNEHRQNSQEGSLVAFAPNGTFMVAWMSFAQVPPANENLSDTFARRFSASPGDEPCVATPGILSCDTGRTGGELEVQHGFGGPGSGLPFLGDIDGDGRDDPCLYIGGVFRCDTDHEGGAAETLIPFVVPGATLPLLGDVDGDGRADPCLYGSGAFHCDTRHDGGAAELRIVFGQKGETPLLGDVNGDGRAEACAFAGGLFRCDTAHNGGKAELLLPFGRKGDQPLLGDFDGDGRDDPCVFRKRRLLCDTAHDGGGAEGTLTLGGAKDRLVMGNLDGL